jgi:hypothetical protein
MTGIERRKFEMLLRVHNFGNTHAALFAASPVAQRTFASLETAINELTATSMQKMAASAAARADQKVAARKALMELLSHAGQLARSLRAEGHAISGFEAPASKDAVSLVTAGRQFAVDAAQLEAEFSGHGMSPAQITATTDAFETATSERGAGRTRHVAARARIHDVLAAAIRGVERLDLIIANDLGDDHVVQAEWKQLRRRENTRGPRNGGEPAAPAGQPPATETHPVSTVAQPVIPAAQPELHTLQPV